MLELLVPPTPAQTNQCGGDSDVYDANLRPELTVRAGAELADSGLTPELWKLEGMATSQEYAEIAAACRADGGRSGCLVLGRGADEDAVDRWLSLAAPVPGFVGFAVGRTLWWNPLEDAMNGASTAADAASRIAANYLRLIDVYLRAAAAASRRNRRFDVKQEHARRSHESRKQLHGHRRSAFDLTSTRMESGPSGHDRASIGEGAKLREQSAVIDEHAIDEQASPGRRPRSCSRSSSRIEQLATGDVTRLVGGRR